jgi:hypothetical protein
MSMIDSSAKGMTDPENSERLYRHPFLVLNGSPVMPEEVRHFAAVPPAPTFSRSICRVKPSATMKPVGG